MGLAEAHHWRVGLSRCIADPLLFGGPIYSLIYAPFPFSILYNKIDELLHIQKKIHDSAELLFFFGIAHDFSFYHSTFRTHRVFLVLCSLSLLSYHLCWVLMLTVHPSCSDLFQRQTSFLEDPTVQKYWYIVETKPV